MRVLKFRAWYKPESKMYQWGSGVIAIDHLLTVETVETVPHGRILKSADVELMQFTGVHDLLGTEIYEGDIVSVENAAWGVVTFGVGCFRVEHPDGHKLALEDTQESMLRVIGTIYEHPHLLSEAST